MMPETTFKEALLAQLKTAGETGIRVTPAEQIAAAELVKHDEAQAFLNGFGYLYIRSA